MSDPGQANAAVTGHRIAVLGAGFAGLRAATTLRALFRIEVIGNVHVTRLVEGVKDSVFARVRDFERAAFEAVMQEQFDDAERYFARLDAVGSALQWAMPPGVDVAAMTSKMRAFLEMQRRRSVRRQLNMTVLNSCLAKSTTDAAPTSALDQICWRCWQSSRQSSTPSQKASALSLRHLPCHS